ncbi:MAG: hypothetical protein QQN41_12580 [Nitrosopumilus sp.]
MIRQLTEEERKLCIAGLKRRKQTLIELKEELSYFEEFNEFNRKHKKYLEKREEKAKQKRKLILDATLNQLVDSIKEEKRMIKVEQNQLDNGVEIKKIKKMVGVS